MRCLKDDKKVYLKCSQCKKVQIYEKDVFKKERSVQCHVCNTTFTIIWGHPFKNSGLKSWMPFFVMTGLSIFIIFVISFPFFQTFYVFNRSVTALNPIFASILIPALCSFISIIVAKWSENSEKVKFADQKGKNRADQKGLNIKQVIAIVVEGVALIFTINIIMQTHYCSLQIANPDTEVIQQYYGNAIEDVASGNGRLFDGKGNLIYIGEFKNSLFDGFGKTYEWIDSVHNTNAAQSYQCTYEGFFKNGLRNGQGCEYRYDAEYDFEKEKRVSPYLYYEGNFIEGEYCGQGTMYGKEEKYEGGFSAGKYNGYGNRYILDQGDKMIYRCEGIFSDGALDGLGKKYYSNGSIAYEGKYEKDSFVSGTAYFKNGKIKYTGGWKEAKYNGEGILYWENGNVRYDGNWVDHKRSGHGESYREDGTKEYTGGWKEDQYSGYGELYYEDGVTPQYKGRYNQNMQNGHGTSFYKNGEKRYEGDWVSGEWQGDGTWHWEDGKPFYEGQFEKGKMHGEGVTYWENGAVNYEGSFQENKRNGEGKTYSKTKKLEYDGEFVDDMRHGEGTLFWDNGKRQYDGNWQENKYSGQGTEYDINEVVIHRGLFNDGEFVSSAEE